MELRERLQDVRELTSSGGDGPDSTGNNLAAARETGERFLRAADRAIERALSGDSESFLRASRQEGGQ